MFVRIAKETQNIDMVQGCPDSNLSGVPLRSSDFVHEENDLRNRGDLMQSHRYELFSLIFGEIIECVSPGSFYGDFYHRVLITDPCAAASSPQARISLDYVPCELAEGHIAAGAACPWFILLRSSLDDCADVVICRKVRNDCIE